MKHKEGDIVMIREWDDMVREFGVDKDGDINTPKYCFTRDMRGYCGTFMKIKQVIVEAYKMQNFDEWNFSDAMFTDWEPPKKEVDAEISPIIDKNGKIVSPSESQRNTGSDKESGLDWLGEEIKKHMQKALSDAELPTIADSGDRTEFPTGAVRDMHAGKGRMDLLPFYAILELSKLCESGAIKYGEHNADKGIPQHSLIDSAMRHLFKYAAGYTDEDHLLAAFWNLGRAVNQRTTHPELIDVPWKG